MKTFIQVISRKSILYLVPVIFGLIMTSVSNFLIKNFLVSILVGTAFTYTFHFVIAPRYMKFPSSFFRKQQSFLVAIIVFAFLFIVPTNVDRSISVWLLAKTYNQQVISKNELSKYAVAFFADTPTEIDRRVSEQISIGNLVEDKDGEYELSFRGQKTVEAFRLLATFFHLNKKYSNGD